MPSLKPSRAASDDQSIGGRSGGVEQEAGGAEFPPTALASRAEAEESEEGARMGGPSQEHLLEEGATVPIQGSSSEARDINDMPVSSRHWRVSSSIANLGVLVPDASSPAGESPPEGAEVIHSAEVPSPVREDVGVADTLLKMALHDEGPTPPPSFSIAGMMDEAAERINQANEGMDEEAGMGGLDNYPARSNMEPEEQGAAIAGRPVPSRSRRVSSSISELDVLVPGSSFPAAASPPEGVEVAEDIDAPSSPDHAAALHDDSLEKMPGKKPEVVADDAPAPFDSAGFEDPPLVDKSAPAAAHHDQNEPEVQPEDAPAPFDSAGFKERPLTEKLAAAGAHDERSASAGPAPPAPLDPEDFAL